MHLLPPNYVDIPGWKIAFDSQEEAEKVMSFLRARRIGMDEALKMEIEQLRAGRNDYKERFEKAQAQLLRR